jgi:eukaryotic-like serine/threonine-protein kinase
MTFLSDSALERLRVAADAPDLTGTRYHLLGKLGQGGMGGVFRVDDSTLEREVALKVINVADLDLSARLLKEARVIAKLEHPGIVPVHDAGMLPDGRPYYTMKLVQGKRIDELGKDMGGIADRLRTFLRICEPVAFAHAHRVLHRDLKPTNIMIGPFGEVLVMDWGLSKALAAGIGSAESGSVAEDCAADPAAVVATAHGSVLGTPGYMAPEQRNGEIVDQRADVYALGAILEFLLQDAQPRVPARLAAIWRKAKAEDRDTRYASVPDLADDVAHFVDGLPVSAYPESIVSRIWRWIARNRTWILLLLVYVVVRALLILFRPR